AANGGVPFYTLDNEPGIWYSSHRDVAPNGLTLDDELSRMLSTSAIIRSVDPTAKIIGPEEWGYFGYLYSGADQQNLANHNYDLAYATDRAAHGNMDAIPWLLQSLHTHDTQPGKTRSLDVLSVHYYPQGNEFSDDVSTATQELRNRSTRSL